MTVKLRLVGDRAEVDKVLSLLSTAMEVAKSEREYPARGGFASDVRVYAEVRPAQTAPPPAADRTPRRKGR
ncbi:hypothetical protein [Actinokineospora spheciospongiae]|uniref:hypothetical protein n=1 Tax=Actinokineospora spheciospongiae TaxID=909613 RepID=UPI000D9006D0|nr:hypothetical protein [Actinokineospora spheciospongiae]PWW50252.1 hypothetical protein DFQ13_12314 [Actinokineospora spheciospongiae]